MTPALSMVALQEPELTSQELRLLALDNAARALLGTYDIPFIEKEIKRIEEWGQKQKITPQHPKYREWNNAITIQRMQKMAHDLATGLQDVIRDLHLAIQQQADLQAENENIRHRLALLEATVSMVANPRVAEYLAKRVRRRK